MTPVSRSEALMTSGLWAERTRTSEPTEADSATRPSNDLRMTMFVVGV